MEEDDTLFQHYLDIGAITLEGMDEKGEMIFAIHEVAKEIAPELWQAHMEYVDDALLSLYKENLIEIEYDENLEAMIHLGPEGFQKAKELGLVQMNFPNPPNN